MSPADGTSAIRSMAAGDVTWSPEMLMSDEQKTAALARAEQRLGQPGQTPRDILGSLWDEAFEQGKLAALDELQDRFCVCMK